MQAAVAPQTILLQQPAASVARAKGAVLAAAGPKSVPKKPAKQAAAPKDAPKQQVWLAPDVFFLPSLCNFFPPSLLSFFLSPWEAGG
jgi:hypothetical protein